MKIVFLLFILFSGIMAKEIDKTNLEFYNSSGSAFDAIPFKNILPELLLKYGTGQKCLEIGSGPGALAVWLKDQGYDVTCIEPAKELANTAKNRGLKVYSLTIQQFSTEELYDCIVAISSLIHVPRKELPDQIKKISNLLNSKGLFFVSFIEGYDEGFEDPTKEGKERFFSKWTESEWDQLLFPYFSQIVSHRIYVPVMDRTFFLKVYAKK